MASRKKPDVDPTVEPPTIEQPSEQPVIAVVAPATPAPSLNVAPVGVERPVAARPSSSDRARSTGNKGRSKSGGKGSPNGGSGSSHDQETSTSKWKKKKAKKKALTVKGFGGDKKRPSKKTDKKGPQKRGLRK